MTQTTPSVRVFTAGDPLPADAVDLFGHEVEEAFRRVEDATVNDAPRPVVIAHGPGDALAGGLYMLIEREPDHDPARAVASIRQLVVRPEHRGRGIAGWLLKRAHAVAEEHGCGRVRSTAGWGCPDHLAMYDRLGYARSPGEAPYLVTRPL